MSSYPNKRPMIFFYRLLPILSALVVGGVFYGQWQQPLAYPWIAAVGILAVSLAMILISRRRVRLADMAEKMLPTFILLVALAFGLLLAEGALAHWVIIIIGSLASFLSLELLFLLSFMPSRYPVNSLSHVNIAYVTFIVWYTAATSVGLMAFLHSPKWLFVSLFVGLSLILFRTTGHPGATREQNRIWMLVGALAGLHVGLLNSALPLSMAAQGTLSMVVLCGILRMRRYLYHPLPGRRQAWIEALTAILLVGTVMGTSRWL